MIPNKTYRGYQTRKWGTKVVVTTDDGRQYKLRHYVRHSPTGFQVGYRGSGPHDLARCLLIDVLGGDSEVVDRTYHAFVTNVVENLKSGYRIDSRGCRKCPPKSFVCWTLTSDQILDWLDTYLRSNDECLFAKYISITAGGTDDE